MDAVGGAKPRVVCRVCRGVRQAQSWEGIGSPSSPGTAPPRARGWQTGTGDHLLTLRLLGAFDDGPFVDTVHFFSDGDPRPDDHDLFPIRAGPRRTVPLAVTRPAGHFNRSSQRGNEAEHGQGHANHLPALTQHKVSLPLCGGILRYLGDEAQREREARRATSLCGCVITSPLLTAPRVIRGHCTRRGSQEQWDFTCNRCHSCPAAPRTPISTQLLIRPAMVTSRP
jgi:hypothetical protein